MEVILLDRCSVFNGMGGYTCVVVRLGFNLAAPTLAKHVGEA